MENAKNLTSLVYRHVESIISSNTTNKTFVSLSNNFGISIEAYRITDGDSDVLLYIELYAVVNGKYLDCCTIVPDLGKERILNDIQYLIKCYHD